MSFELADRLVGRLHEALESLSRLRHAVFRERADFRRDTEWFERVLGHDTHLKPFLGTPCAALLDADRAPDPLNLTQTDLAMVASIQTSCKTGDWTD
jgi:hypothetical protein